MLFVRLRVSWKWLKLQEVDKPRVRAFGVVRMHVVGGIQGNKFESLEKASVLRAQTRGAGGRYGKSISPASSSVVAAAVAPIEGHCYLLAFATRSARDVACPPSA